MKSPEKIALDDMDSWLNTESPALATRAEGGGMSFWTFDSMITPGLIQVIFWIGIAGIFVEGMGHFFAGLDARSSSAPDFIRALVTLLIGPLAWRVVCELLIVVFRIHSVLREVESKLQRP